jgi:hypothetical protein
VTDIKANKNIILGVFSILVGVVVGFVIVRRLFATKQEIEPVEVATFDFYVEQPVEPDIEAQRVQ